MKLKIPAILLALLCTAPSFASHYLPKPGEKPINIRIGTCAITGGFVHLYAGQDYGIFEKYGLKTESIFIRGSGPASGRPRRRRAAVYFLRRRRHDPGVGHRHRCQTRGVTVGEAPLCIDLTQRNQARRRFKR